MKNVAKCDTWCELQNPVNHRVFERKLRPRDPPEGTPAWALEAHQRSVTPTARGHWPPEPQRHGGLKREAVDRVGSGKWWATAHAEPDPRRHTALPDPTTRRPSPPRDAFGPIPQVRRGHPLSLSI